MKGKGFYNQMALPLAFLLVLVLGVFGLQKTTVQSLALEQEVRCGMEAHSHTAACYENNRLICYETVHSHSQNCYLVLLKDNDINDLLGMVEQQQDNSLESLILQTVDKALRYNTDLTSPPTAQVIPVDVPALNETVAENNITPAVVLNEDIRSAAAGLNDQMGGASVLNGSTTLALGDTASTSQKKANYYAWLDGRWQMVGTLSFTTGSSGSGSSRRYYARTTATNIRNLYNDALGTSLATADLELEYASLITDTSWSDASLSGSYVYFGQNYSRERDASPVKAVRLMDGNQPLAFYTVTLQYDNGTQTTQIVRAGTNFTLPADTAWLLNGTTYEGGSTVEIHVTSTFTQTDPDPRLKISYQVNFPTVSGVAVSTAPTLAGTALSSTVDYVDDQADSRIRNVSQQDVKGSVNNNGTGLSRVIHFQGWKIQGTDTILSPNATLTWTELQNAVDSSGTLTLVGVWEYSPLQTVSFFVRYDSVAVDTQGNITGQDSTQYTNQLFAAFVGGVDTTMSTGALTTAYGVADVTADNSYTADQAIRALYGQKGDGVWLTAFPSDEYVFELLKKEETGKLRVDGETVGVEELNDNVYTIRWFVFKCQSDAWHIDGRLVKKEGLLDVSKSFAGNRATIEQIKDGFYIRLSHQVTGQAYYLYLTQPAVSPTDGEVVLPGAVSGDTYTWRVSGMKYGDPWRAEEYNPSLSDVVVHSDYRIVDTYGSQSRVGTGSVVDFYGSTIATDMDEWYPLAINVTNIYHNTDSLIIKKEDAITGSPLGGAVFRLMQNGKVMTFTYDEAENIYRYDPQGPVNELVGSSGYYELNIRDFSYADGNVEVQELQAPPGYTPIENIVIGWRSEAAQAAVSADESPPAGEETQPIADSPPAGEESLPAEGSLSDGEENTGDAPTAAVAAEEPPAGVVEMLSASPMASYREGLLIIRNSTESTSVTVSKQWLCPSEEWRPVTMQLMANGMPVTALISGVELTRVLDDSNGWSTTWDDLPLYANGAEIVWSVREIKVGSENCLSDYSFVNWLVDYSPPTYTYNSAGVLSNTAFTVTNDTYRTMLRLIKTNLGGGIRLEGATFTLEYLVNGVPDPGFVVRTMTTAGDGTITFDNLFFGDYRLTEISAPSGYQPLDTPIYLTIESNGAVTVQEHSYALPGSTAYTVQVLNCQQLPLPETGGLGRSGYLLTGLACIAASLMGFSVRKRKRECAPDG